MITPRKFWIYLLVVTAATIVSLFLIDVLVPAAAALSPFILGCVAVFVLINILAYFAGVRAVHSQSKYRFVHLMMGLIIFKMLICVVLVLAHLKINQPESRLFVFPFLMIYLIFTFFEIYVLEKIARTHPPEQKT